MKSFKIFCSLIILFLTLFLTGCDRTRPIILFNNQPINTQTVNSPVTIFQVGETLHYVLLNPQGFDSPYLRIQLIKKNTKVQNWGFGVDFTRNVKIDTTKKFYIDSLKLNNSGSYIMSIFYISDLNRPIARATFVVK